MTDQAQHTSDDAGSPAAVKERAELGKDILGARVARGEPGEKQPAHDDPRLSASKTVEKLDEIVKQFEGEVYGSSMERAKQTGNLNPVAPHERSIQRGPMVLQAAATAAGAIGAARDALTTQLEADARLTSDPRYERDQKVYELGQQGKLGMVPPTQAEQAAAAARAGLPPEIAELTPKTAEEQVAEDMPRLAAAERAPNAAGAANVARTEIEAGKQDMAEKNNGGKAQAEGRTGQAAVERAKASEAAAESRPATTTPGTIKPGTPIPSSTPMATTATPPSSIGGVTRAPTAADQANAADAARREGPGGPSSDTNVIK